MNSSHDSSKKAGYKLDFLLLFLHVFPCFLLVLFSLPPSHRHYHQNHDFLLLLFLFTTTTITTTTSTSFSLSTSSSSSSSLFSSSSLSLFCSVLLYYVQSPSYSRSTVCRHPRYRPTGLLVSLLSMFLAPTPHPPPFLLYLLLLLL